jgi:phosphate-selective porin OprO and OprP
MRNSFIPRFAPVLAALFALLPAVKAEELSQLREQLQALEQKILVLERKQELKDETATAATKGAPKITVSDGRVSLASGDGSNSLRLRGLVQADVRWFDSDLGSNDNFIIRRARIGLEGTFSKIANYQMVGEFGGSSPSLLDANLTLQPSKAFGVKIGRFRSPVGLEQLQSASALAFVERSLATNLIPNRDLGVQVQGTAGSGTFDYALGVFNGTPDRTSIGNSTDFDNKVHLAGRIFLSPFKSDKDSALQGLGFGLGCSTGNSEGVSGYGSYVSAGQQRIFAYNSGTVAAGRAWRFSPQACLYEGPFSVQTEYVMSSQVLANSGLTRTARHKAWQLTTGYVMTGEDASYGGVTPNQPFNPAVGSWGAWEIVFRAASLDIDDVVFTGPSALASANSNATKDTSFGLGLNWYLSKSLRVLLSINRDTFDLTPGATPAAASILNDRELSIFSRAQLSF